MDSQDDRYEMKGSIMPALSGRMKSPRRLTTKSDPGAGLQLFEPALRMGNSFRQ